MKRYWRPVFILFPPVVVLDNTSSVINQFHKPQCQYIDMVPITYPAPWEGRGKGPKNFPFHAPF
jgi:hypothetical protein